MKYIANCSGGKDSVATLILAQTYGEPLDEVLYCEVMFDEDISGELPIHRNFIYNTLKPWVEDVLNVPFTIVRSDETFVTLFNRRIKKKTSKNCGLKWGFPIGGFCWGNNYLKIKPLDKYSKALGEHITYQGLAYDEPKRLENMKKRNPNAISLLEKYHITENEAKTLCLRNGLLSPIYNIVKRTGCWFCPNATIKEWRYIYDNYPELWNKYKEMASDKDRVVTRVNRKYTIEQLEATIREERGRKNGK